MRTRLLLASRAGDYGPQLGSQYELTSRRVQHSRALCKDLWESRLVAGSTNSSTGQVSPGFLCRSWPPSVLPQALVCTVLGGSCPRQTHRRELGRSVRFHGESRVRGQLGPRLLPARLRQARQTIFLGTMGTSRPGLRLPYKLAQGIKRLGHPRPAPWTQICGSLWAEVMGKNGAQ